MLSDKRKVFVEEYLKSWNATEAARIAGYAYPNVEGSRLLVNASIAAEIKARLTDKVMSADEVLVRLSEQARGEHANYISATGFVNVPLMVAEGKAHLIKGIKETQFGKVIEFYDAQAALVHIGKHHKLFADKLDVNVSGALDFTADERAKAQQQIKEWQEQQKKSNATSNG